MFKKLLNVRVTLVLLGSMLLAVLGGRGAMAQVTSAAINGVVTDQKGAPLPGATVVAVHEPSGTRYGTTTNAEGRYSLPAVRTGGPYQVTSSYVGFKDRVEAGFSTALGVSAVINFVLLDEGTQLSEVVVTSQRNDTFNSEKTGAATNISSQQLRSLPSISRSLNDFTRLTPQSNGNGNFAGRDGRYNNVTVDGSNFNNNFGLSAENLPGGGAQPISLDAIEEVQVNIAPYDVRQANFTGAGINAITRSGGNQFKGTAYTFYRDQSFSGTKVGDVEVANIQKVTNQIIGGSLGGPIIKNKLFFFVNGEYEKNVRPGTAFAPTGSSTATDPSNTSRTTVADLQLVSNFVRDRYGYETGAYENFANNFTLQNTKILARIDWNINDRNKLSLRYTNLNNTDDQIINGTSAPNPRFSSNRISQNSYSYANSQYGFKNTVQSLALELNSTFGGKLSNQLLGTFTNIRDQRTSPSSPFPFVDILKGGDSYISLGYELFTFKNDVKNNTFNIIDNLTYYAGKHVLTAGVSYENMDFGNSFIRYGTSYYRFSSIESFIGGGNPTAFAYTYPLAGNDTYAQLNFGQASVYAQDEFNVTKDFKVTLGVRIDAPIYGKPPLTNPAVSALTFANGEKINTGLWPNTKPGVSPRIGFNWNKGNTLQIRGGTGIFNGRIPFVWFTNQPTNAGMSQFTYETTTAADLAKLKFNPDPTAYLSTLPQIAGQTSPSSLAVVDPEFKMPQVWRTNFAVEKKLPGRLTVGVEGIYTKEMTTVYQRNINQAAPVGTLTGPDNRPVWSGSNTTRRVNPAISEAMVLGNTNQGSSLFLTAQVSKAFNNGFYASASYTFNDTKDVTGNPGSQAASAWSGNVAVGDLNNLPLSPSNYAVPHRVIGSVSYKVSYLKTLATTISLFYQGQHQGRFSYRYANDLNGDGVTADLLYVPRDASEITFSPITTGTGATATVKYTPEQQAAAFMNYVNQDTYLSSRKGQYAERNGALLPWLNQVDMKILQDFGVKVGNRVHKLQASIDVFNVGNLLNSDWGVRSRTTISNSALLTAVTSTPLTAARPTYRLVETGGQLPTSTFVNNVIASNTWYAQVGLRYIFD